MKRYHAYSAARDHVRDALHSVSEAAGELCNGDMEGTKALVKAQAALLTCVTALEGMGEL